MDLERYRDPHPYDIDKTLIKLDQHEVHYLLNLLLGTYDNDNNTYVYIESFRSELIQRLKDISNSL